MADTVNFTTYAAQVDGAAGIELINDHQGAWTAVLVGPLTGISFLEANGDGTQKSSAGGFEWVERPSATPPALTLTGHRLSIGESFPIGDLGAGRTVYARSLNAQGGVLVATRGG